MPWNGVVENQSLEIATGPGNLVKRQIWSPSHNTQYANSHKNTPAIVKYGSGPLKCFLVRYRNRLKPSGATLFDSTVAFISSLRYRYYEFARLRDRKGTSNYETLKYRLNE